MSARLSEIIATTIAAMVLTGCTSVDSPRPTASEPASAVAQARSCGRLAQDVCVGVIGAVEAQVPETRSSPVAVADYSTPGIPRPTAGDDAQAAYLVAFAPLPGEDIWMNPPTWHVSGSPTGWTVTHASDLKSLNVCFILLLGGAGLTDYAPTVPSGVCE